MRLLILPLLALLACPPAEPPDDDPAPGRAFDDAPAFEPAPVEGLIPPAVGNGLAVRDLDGDGLPELFVTDVEGSRLYRNLGDFRFEEWPSQPWREFLVAPYDQGATFVDADDDGDADLFLSAGERDRLFLLDGETFTEHDAGLRPVGGSFTFSFTDFDGDGRLDLYATTHGLPQSGPPGEEVEVGGPDVLYRGVGDARFEDVSHWLPAGAADGRGFSGRWSDFDHDGDPDLYLVNEQPPDQEPNHLFRNDGPGPGGHRFTLADAQCLCDVAAAGMGLAIGDADRDGWQDVFLTNTTVPGLDLDQFTAGEVFLRNDWPLFTDAGEAVGLRVGALEEERRTISWGAEWFDADHDGWQDLYVAYGPFAEDPFSPQPNALMRNRGGSFELWEDSGASDLADGRAVVAVDLDRDGCLDLLVANTEGPTTVLRHRCEAVGSWLELELVGAAPLDAPGAVARVTAGGVTQRHEVLIGAVFAGPSRILHVGLREAEEADVVISWPSGATTELTLAAGERHRIVE